MSDKDDKPIIQTRTGAAQGASTERQMLDSRQDSNGIRTIIREHQDGSTTMCRTRAGFVEFITTKPENEEEELVPLFLETGHTQYPTAMTINNYHGLADGQGRWWFKVSVESDWLGYIKNSFGRQWKRFNRKLYKIYGGATPPDPAIPLYDGMVSPATSIPIKGAVDATWIDAMLKKRKAIVTCPASMFSGKMRLFMQAKYGKILTKKQTVDGHFEIESDDAFGVRVDGLLLSNLGGVGAGIFTTTDNRHFLLRISGANVTVFKLKPEKEYEELVKKLRSRLNNTDDPLSAVEREQVESYIFAACRIEPPYYTIYSNVLPVCNPIVYGWSFNWGGNKADIIDVQASGMGTNARFTSTHYSVTISHNKLGEDDVFQFAVSTVSVETWVDGRGSYHIFTPDYGSGGRMSLFSLGLGTTQIACTGKFHCFYDKSGELIIARYNRGPDSPVLQQYYSNDADYKGSSNPESPSYNLAAVCVGRRKATYKYHSGYYTGSQSFVVSDTVYGGAFESSSGTSVTEIYHGMGCAAPAQVRAMAGWVVGIEAYGCGHAFEGWSGYGPVYSSDTYIYKAHYFFWTEENLGRISDIYQQPTLRVFHTVVIPFFDCCAVHVYARDGRMSGSVSVTRNHETCYNTTYGAHRLTNVRYDPEGPVYEGYNDCVGNEFMSGWHRVDSSESFSKNLGAVQYRLDITHFHGALSTTPTESPGTLNALFTVSQYYPYVDAQIWTSVNAGGTSAQLPVYNPDQYRRWTGWV